jgi:hypothetical protein
VCFFAPTCFFPPFLRIKICTPKVSNFWGAYHLSFHVVFFA